MCVTAARTRTATNGGSTSLGDSGQRERKLIRRPHVSSHRSRGVHQVGHRALSHGPTQRARIDDVPGPTAGQPLDEIALVPGGLAEVAALVVEHERVARVHLRGGHVIALVDLAGQRPAVELVQTVGQARAARDPVVEPVALAPRVGPQQQPALTSQPGAEAAGGQDLLPRGRARPAARRRRPGRARPSGHVRVEPPADA